MKKTVVSLSVTSKLFGRVLQTVSRRSVDFVSPVGGSSGLIIALVWAELSLSFLQPFWSVNSRTGHHMPAAPCQLWRQQTSLSSCSMTSWGLHSRTALALKVPTSYCNFITTDYLSMSTNLFQNYCSARQNTLLGKRDWHFLFLVILYFT